MVNKIYSDYEGIAFAINSLFKKKRVALFLL